MVIAKYSDSEFGEDYTPPSDTNPRASKKLQRRRPKGNQKSIERLLDAVDVQILYLTLTGRLEFSRGYFEWRCPHILRGQKISV